MKEILLQIENESFFEKMLEFENKSDFLKKIKENTYNLQFEDNYDSKLQIKSDENLVNLSMYLLSNYITKNYEIYQEKILTEMIYNAYYRITMTLELDRFFRRNEIFKESVFMKFNTHGLKNDIDFIIENEKRKRKTELMYNDITKQLKNIGIDIKAYKSVHIEYDNENEIHIISNKNNNYNLSPSNISKKLPISVQFDELNDKLLIDVSFCSVLIVLLKIEEIEIPKEYTGLYELLIEQISRNQIDCMITLI